MEMELLNTRIPKWRWHVFGGDELVVTTHLDFGWLMRWRARTFLGSRFVRLPE